MSHGNNFELTAPTLRGTPVVRTLRRAALLLLAIGALGAVVTALSAPHRLAANYLVGVAFLLNIAATATFFSALLFLVHAGWSASVRRLGEFVAGLLPWVLLGLLPIIVAPGSFYHWTHELHTDALIAQKSWYLDPWFFRARLVLYALLWLGMYRFVIGNSLRQDEAEDYAPTLRNVRGAGVWVLIYALSFTFAAVDLLMTLEAHWYSTIFGVYIFAGSFVATLGVITLLAVVLREQGYLRDFITVERYHDLGKLVFAFSVFWAYIAFSQYMLIWYGNLPEETVYFLKRMGRAEWQWIGIVLPIVRFALPFALLLRRDAKRNPAILLTASTIVVLGHYLDLAWIVLPAFGRDGLGWQEVAIFAGFVGIGAGMLSFQLERAPTVAVRDPYLRESLETTSG
jgi:hypothetical protein